MLCHNKRFGMCLGLIVEQESPSFTLTYHMSHVYAMYANACDPLVSTNVMVTFMIYIRRRACNDRWTKWTCTKCIEIHLNTFEIPLQSVVWSPALSCPEWRYPTWCPEKCHQLMTRKLKHSLRGVGPLVSGELVQVSTIKLLKENKWNQEGPLPQQYC